MRGPLAWFALALGLTVLAVWASGGVSAGIDGDALARLAYLGILAALVGAWAVRMPQQNMIRNALLWTLVILGLVAAYSLRGVLF